MGKNDEYCVEIQGVASVFVKEISLLLRNSVKKWMFIVPHEERDDCNKRGY